MIPDHPVNRAIRAGVVKGLEEIDRTIKLQAQEGNDRPKPKPSQSEMPNSQAQSIGQHKMDIGFQREQGTLEIMDREEQREHEERMALIQAGINPETMIPFEEEQEERLEERELMHTEGDEEEIEDTPFVKAKDIPAMHTAK